MTRIRIVVMLVTLLWAVPAVATCLRDNKGQIVCGAGMCVNDRRGDVYCAALRLGYASYDLCERRPAGY